MSPYGAISMQQTRQKTGLLPLLVALAGLLALAASYRVAWGYQYPPTARTQYCDASNRIVAASSASQMFVYYVNTANTGAGDLVCGTKTLWKNGGSTTAADSKEADLMGSCTGFSIRCTGSLEASVIYDTQTPTPLPSTTVNVDNTFSPDLTIQPASVSVDLASVSLTIGDLSVDTSGVEGVLSDISEGWWWWLYLVLFFGVFFALVFYFRRRA